MNSHSKHQNCYDDIINLPHHVSSSHPHMPLLERAAQFSPFAALSGHGEAISESARLTETKRELDEHTKRILDWKLQAILMQLENHPLLEITYFQPDSKKDGGAYASVTGRVEKINSHNRTVLMQDGLEISIDNITDISGEIFHSLEYL